MLLVASRDIRCGEELTINYIDIIKPVWERRSMLKEKSHFLCVCERCVEEELIEINKTRWTTLDKIYEEHVNGNWEEVLNLSSKIIDLEFRDLQCDVIEILVLRLTFEALHCIERTRKSSLKYQTTYRYFT